MKLAFPLAATVAALLVIPAPALAGTVAVRVVDASGQPVPDAVITIHPAAGVPAG
ncbi:MAG: methylamine utilization protein, partial [Sphingomonadales bacterium]|nr:methylamine utilization protein [Sphingomonadales bacterium]